MTRVVIVEDEPQLRRALGINLRARRYKVETVAADEAALTSAGIAGMVAVDEETLHMIAGLNADQYAAEMRGQLASALQRV